MKTQDILLDMQFSLSNARREPTIGDIMNPHYLVIKGVKFTLVLLLEIGNDSSAMWNEFFSSAKEFFVYDPDNHPIMGVDSGKINEWIAGNILFKDINDFASSSYKDAQDWALNSPLVELDLCEA